MDGPSARRPRLEALFREQTARTPDATAIVHRGVGTSYAALDARSDRIARHLAARGVRRGETVGVCLERSPDLVATILGVLKAGAAYLPLDPAYPSERTRYMIRDSGTRHLVSRTAYATDLGHSDGFVDLDRDAARIDAMPAGPPDPQGDAADPAYVIYTSGSSGVPKGVVLAHTATRLVDWAKRAFPDGQIARVAATTSACFDPSIIETFVPLCTGGAMILKENALERFEPDDRPTMLAAPPSVIATMLAANAIPASVRVVNIGGEALTAGLVEALYARTGVERVFNHYGPTEATTCTTVAMVPRGSTGSPPIGTPICGARVYVLDAAGQPVADGREGELHIAGPTLAIGYVGGADRADPRFVADPFVAGDRMYRTGDLGHRDADGQLHFHGRIDDQVKVRGHRVEIGEVAAALRGLDGVADAIVLPRTGAAGRVELVAYVVAAKGRRGTDIRRALADVLPAHMLPGHCVTLDAFPLSPSGKIDRDALPDVSFDAAVPEPASPTEELVADAFRRHLGRPVIGADDDFFEIGGDSLLAVDVALDLEVRLGVEVTAALLAHHATPRALGESIDRGPVSFAEPITPIQPEGDGPPIFCTPDLFGHSLSFASVVRHLGRDQPFFGLSPGPMAADIIRAPSMAILTEGLADAIQAFRPDGPCLIAGYSFGASFAHALACVLEARGRAVTLILIDAAQGARPPGLAAALRWATRETRRVLALDGALGVLRRLYRTRYYWRRWLAPDRSIADREVPRFVPAPRRAIARALMEVHSRFVPGRFAGATLLIRCRHADAMTLLHDGDGMLGWRAHLAGPTTVIEVPGTHHAMMREPVAVSVADAIRDFLPSR